MSKTFYITTPIFYPNARPHMGHAYTITLTDIIARHHRRIGDDTYFLTGTDENTEKVVRAARAVGQDPTRYVDGTVEKFKSLYQQLNISHDQFIRTTDEQIHFPGAQELWRRLDEAGDLEKRAYSGLYCTGHEAFVTEKELVDGKCPDHDETPEKIEEENWFFKLSKYTHQIKQKIECDELEIFPQSRKNEILALLDRGLEDVSFSRPADKMTFGVPVPNDSSQKMYVWCDALANYITALGFGRGDERLRYWPGIHVIGKDILRFHAAIWPGMLLSAKLPLPKTILVHGFITSGGRKMSKTLGNVIDPQELIDKYGSEAVRYYLARHISPFEDSNMTREGFHEAYTANLVNGIGNLVSRVMQMASVHNVKLTEFPNFKDFLEDKTFMAEKDFNFSAYINSLNNYDINKAADDIWNDIKWVDAHIQSTQPFKKIHDNKQEATKDIRLELEILWQIGLKIKPFMPETAKEIQDAIRENKKPESLFARIEL